MKTYATSQSDFQSPICEWSQQEMFNQFVFTVLRIVYHPRTFKTSH